MSGDVQTGDVYWLAPHRSRRRRRLVLGFSRFHVRRLNGFCSGRNGGFVVE